MSRLRPINALEKRLYHGTAFSLSRLYDHTQAHHTRWDSSGRVIRPSQRPVPDNRQISMPPTAGFEPAIPLRDRAATGIGTGEVPGSIFAHGTNNLDVFLNLFLIFAMKCQENTTTRQRPLPDPSQFISDLIISCCLVPDNIQPRVT
jgi:hypothetical protein